MNINEQDEKTTFFFLSLPVRLLHTHIHILSPSHVLLPCLFAPVILLNVLHPTHTLTPTILIDNGDLAGRGAPIRPNGDAELAHADAEQLQEPRLAGIEDVALAADDEALGPVGVAGLGPRLQHDPALDHAGGDVQPPQLRLQRVAERHVVLGRHLAPRAVHRPPRDRERPRRHRPRPREVHLALRERPQVRHDGRRVPVREEQPYGPLHEARQPVRVLREAIFRVVAEGAGHEFGFAEE